MFFDFVYISMHFIDETWSLKQWVINFCSLRRAAYWDAVVEWLEDWGLKSKISTVTMSSSNDDDIFDYIKAHLQGKKNLSLYGQLFRVYSCGEFITQMVQ
ncbi:hypothetical protein L484_026143 [Morus notabilis]|uniref:Uncharacterized protein n=1 Tax=Morus notabilis TaxID=981085 RepID=W9RIQ1_9ROSA|nr:hypothetical protein L484_026143 [Morus notabilis]